MSEFAENEPSIQGSGAASTLENEVGPTLLRLLTELATEMKPGLEVGVNWDSRLDRDLGLDSLARVELLMRLERHLDVSLREEELAVAETPRDLLHMIGGSKRVSWRIEAAGVREGVPRTSGAMALKSTGSRSKGLASGADMPVEARTIIEVLDWHCERQPERRYLLHYAEGDRIETLTYGELRERSMEVAAGLRAQGFTSGEPVAMMLPTSLDYFYLFYGILAAGLLPVPLYPPVRPSQLEDHLRRQVRILDNCRAPLMVTIGEAKAPARLLQSQVASLRSVLTMDELRQASVDAPRVLHPGRGSDLAFLQYTSGSTGQPKGVSLSHENLLANLRAMLASAEISSEDVFVSWLPLYHDMGLIGAGMATLYGGFPLVVMSPLVFLARPSRWLRAISEHGGTVSGGPNFAYELCLSKIPDRELEGLDLSSWRLAFNGAEPVQASTLRRFVERFEPYGLSARSMHPVYGLAESSLGIAFPPPGRLPRIDQIERGRFVREARAEPCVNEDSLSFVGCGFPLAGHQIRIADDAGHEVAERAIGRVQFRGPSATRGYYRNPEQTRRLMVGDWLDSGDLGYMAGGELFLTGRRKDLIIKAGRNLSPYEIEEAVGDLEGIRKGCVAAFAEGEVLAPGDTDGQDEPSTGTERLIVVAETRVSDSAAREALRQQVFALVVDVVGIAADDVVLAPPGSVLKTSSGKIRRAASRELYRHGSLGKARPAIWRQFANLALSSVAPLARRASRGLGAIVFTGYVGMVVLMVVAPLALLALAVPGARRRQLAVRWAARSLLRLAGVRLDVAGLEHLTAGLGQTEVPAAGSQAASKPTLLAVNHSSYADAVVIAAGLLPGPKIVAKRELAPITPLRWLWRRVGVEMVERFDREQSVEDARSMLDQLRAGWSLVVFPEGTFTRIPGLLPFRMGSFKVAVEANVSVTPVVLRGTRSVLRAGDWLIRRGRVSLRVLPPIHPRGSDWSAAVELRDQVRAATLAHCGEPDLIEEREEGLERLRAARQAR